METKSQKIQQSYSTKELRRTVMDRGSTTNVRQEAQDRTNQAIHRAQREIREPNPNN